MPLYCGTIRKTYDRCSKKLDFYCSKITNIQKDSTGVVHRFASVGSYRYFTAESGIVCPMAKTREP